MSQVKKRNFYEIDPRFFKDASGDGVGDLKGLSKKVSYFKFLGINTIILNNVLSSESNESEQTFKSVAKELGDLSDLSKFITLASRRGIDVVLSINIGFVKENHEWFEASKNEETQELFSEIIEFKKEKDNKAHYKYSSEVNAYYAINEKTQEIPLNWKSSQVSKRFIEVIKFWAGMGVKGFIVKKFEYLTTPFSNEIMSESTINQLKIFYSTIKQIDDSLIIIGESSIIPIKYAKTYTSGITQVFDYFLPREIANLGTSNKFGRDAIGNFKPADLQLFLKKYVNDNSIIISFGNENIGRVTSRWGNDGLYSNESAKALALALMISTSSYSIYYGDEIGMRNIGLSQFDDFQDETLNERKRIAEWKKLSTDDFMDAQILQGPINARALMQWSAKKNGAFSTSDKTITPVSSTYKEINVNNQYSDKNSALNFYKKLIWLTTSTSFVEIFDNAKYKISSNHGVLIVSIINKPKKIVALINLTDSIKKVKKQRNGKIVLSTYVYKKYYNLPSELEPFEGVLISTEAPVDLENPKGTNEIKTDENNDLAEQFEKNKKEKKKNNEDAKKILDKEREIITNISMEKSSSSISEVQKSSSNKKLKLEEDMEVAKKIRKEEKTFKQMASEVGDNEITSLTEADIASTTQIDVDPDNIDLDDFLDDK